MQCAPKAIEFAEIMQNNGHYAIQGHFGANRKLICDFLLVISTNLLPILHLFRDIAFDRSKVPNAVEILPKMSTA